ncbi:hypothetical protein [Paenibacillus sp. Y412MC10]|uniref:hypothetical protein n=1 Tax=Geobacillus sp. (strain Y412MC10) TaxID=481743 RepID=UPI0011AB8994|nr:hypothetical protein [Paenibacillus sp. Y412MC10]
MLKKRNESRLLKLARMTALAAVLAGSAVIATAMPAAADSAPAVPDYEVKLFMNPSVVLDSNHDLKNSVRDYFGMPSSKTKISVEYLDTDDLDINKEGWDVRVRKLEDYDDDEFELTYKMRYPIVDGNIDAALAQAAEDGFDADEDDYEAQVDWGYQKQTLSFSNKKTVSHDGYDGMDNLGEDDAIEEAVDHAPGKFEDWKGSNWGTDLLEGADKKGPVDGKRWTGDWNGREIDVEVYAIIQEDGSGYDYIVEASFKTDTRIEAAADHDRLQGDLTEEGWFLPTDELKTNMILNRY